MDNSTSNSGSRNRLIQKFAASRFLTTSLLLHLILIFILGGVVLFKVTNRDAFEAVGSEGNFLQESEADIEEQEPVQEFEEPTSAAPQEIAPAAISPQSVISAFTDTHANWNTTALADQMTTGTSLSATKALSAIGKTGNGGAPGAGGGRIGNGKMSGSLFGVKIQTSKLGIILDVSGSAHKYLALAIAEIEQSFGGATIILNPGCGMIERMKERDFDIEPAKSVAARFENDSKQVKTVFGQIGTCRSTYPNDADKIEHLLKLDNVFVVVNDLKYPCNGGTQFAFERLINDGADTIYWFADFTDKIDEEEAQSVATELKAKNIKVIAHNFVGQPVNEGGKLIVEATGGTAISKIPGK
jgi:hypothetical protein